MLLVADANILFSFFNPKSKAREIVLSGYVGLFSPIFLLKELGEHKEEIKEKFELNEVQFILTLELIKRIVEFVPLRDFKEFVKEADAISPDIDDTQYLSLALRLNLPIWSNDARLKQQSRIRIFSTTELVRHLSGISDE